MNLTLSLWTKVSKGSPECNSGDFLGMIPAPIVGPPFSFVAEAEIYSQAKEIYEKVQTCLAFPPDIYPSVSHTHTPGGVHDSFLRARRLEPHM